MHFTSYATLDLNFDEHKPTFSFEMPGWHFVRSYTHMRTLTNALTGAVEAYAFLCTVDTVEGWRADQVVVIKQELRPGAICKSPRVEVHTWDDPDTLNNETLALRYIMCLFGTSHLVARPFVKSPRTDTYTPSYAASEK